LQPISIDSIIYLFEIYIEWGRNYRIHHYRERIQSTREQRIFLFSSPWM